MQDTRSAAAQLARLVLLALVLGGCTLPRSGPTVRELLAGRNEQDTAMHVVPVTLPVAAASAMNETLAFGADLTTAGTVSPDTIRPGDVISVKVWENLDDGLLATTGQNVTALDQIQVDQSGDIFVPYAGRMQASGLTPDQLRSEITATLEPQTPNLQVEVLRVAGDGSTVSVLGGVGAPGVYPIEAPTLRLSAMLAEAGGVQIMPDVAQIRLQRQGRTDTIWLQDLYDNPQFDVALRGGDRVVVEEDRRSFTALGASTVQSRVDFDKRDMSALEAIAAAGGLDARASDPTGVFILREETAETANRVLGRADLAGPQRMAYVVDLTEPAGLFSARSFIVRDEDTLYVTEAPIAVWSRLLGFGNTAVGLAGNTASLGN